MAYSVYLEAKSQGLIGTPGWSGVLSAYLEGQMSTFICPEDKEPHPSPPLNSYVFHPVQNTNLYVPLVPGDKSSFCWLAAPSDLVNCNLPNGLPTPDSYVLIIEDLALNTTWDNSVLVVPQADGSLQCTCEGNPWGHGFTHELLLAPSPYTTMFSPFEPPVKWTVGGNTKVSYGINDRSGVFLKDSTKLLLVEYFLPVADVLYPHTAMDDLTNMTPEMQNALPSYFWGHWGASRARHAGIMNCLFGDGHVEGMRPDAINPTIPTISDTMWKPACDPPLVPGDGG